MMKIKSGKLRRGLPKSALVYADGAHNSLSSKCVCNALLDQYKNQPDSNRNHQIWQPNYQQMVQQQQMIPQQRFFTEDFKNFMMPNKMFDQIFT